jgi:hypothetical protein
MKELAVLERALENFILRLSPQDQDEFNQFLKEIDETSSQARKDENATILQTLVRDGSIYTALPKDEAEASKVLLETVKTSLKPGDKSPAKKAPSTFAEAAAKDTKMSWADICDIDSEEEKEALRQMATFDDDESPESLIRSNEVVIPGKMEEFMPRWHELLKHACRFTGLKLVVSDKCSIEQVVLANLYSVDKNAWSAAKTAAKDSKDAYAAYNSINDVFSFFSRPIDLKRNTNPSHGVLWILYKISLSWHKEAFGRDFDLEKFKMGCTQGDPRHIILEKTKRLFLKERIDECAEMLVSALDRLVYGYIQKIYKNPKSAVTSKYIEQVIRACTKTPTQFLAANARKQTQKVLTVVGDGKNKRTVETFKSHYFKPWITQNELWTPREKAVGENINNAFKQIPRVIEGYDDGPIALCGIAKAAIGQAWQISDNFHGLIQHRKKTIRMQVISGRQPDKKSDKITPNEWLAAKEAVLSDEKTSKKVEDFLKQYSLDPKTNSTANDWVKLIEASAEKYWLDEDFCSIDWDKFEAGVVDPSEYHKQIASVNADADDDGDEAETKKDSDSTPPPVQEVEKKE